MRMRPGAARGRFAHQYLIDHTKAFVETCAPDAGATDTASTQTRAVRAPGGLLVLALGVAIALLRRR